MKYRILSLLCTVLFLFTGCAAKKDRDMSPLMGFDWYTPTDEVKTHMGQYIIMEERTSDAGNIPQTLLDYSGTELFEIPCDVTLCFVSDGLVGFNYHDIQKTDYRDWFEILETRYGVPTEAGNGMASWYENPVGKNTALYLFHLEEGVQISFYVTAVTPDQSYTGKQQEKVPTPELRTPIVPVTPEMTRPETTAIPETTEENSPVSETERINPETVPETETVQEEEQLPEEIPDSGTTETETAASSVSSASTAESTAGSSGASVTSTTTVTTTASAPEQAQTETESPLQNLEFYASPDSERKKMLRYTQLYEYRTEEPGQPWELIMEYENVPFCQKYCDAVLCFTSLGLVGINYFDENVSNYQNWVSELSGTYGSPSEIQADYTVWNENSDGIMIYVFALEDGVQISFFADDTGSELS